MSRSRGVDSTRWWVEMTRVFQCTHRPYCLMRSFAAWLSFCFMPHFPLALVVTGIHLFPFVVLYVLFCILRSFLCGGFYEHCLVGRGMGGGRRLGALLGALYPLCVCVVCVICVCACVCMHTCIETRGWCFVSSFIAVHHISGDRVSHLNL